MQSNGQGVLTKELCCPGAGLSGSQYLPQITSYDYTAPLSEQGRTGQPGVGGPNKYEVMLRKEKGRVPHHTLHDGFALA